MGNARSFNSAFAFASMGYHAAPPPGHGPFCFRIHGQIYHRTGPLHPAVGDAPQYAQIYILDASEALDARLGERANSGCSAPLMNELAVLLQSINPFAQAYKMMWEYELQEEQRAITESRPPPQVIMSIVNNSTADQRRYNTPRCKEVAMIFQNAMGEPPFERDIRIHSRREKRTQQ